jgi:protein disulfide-isomerase
VRNLIVAVVLALGLGAVLLATQKKGKNEPQASAPATPTEAVWLTDYKSAQEQAKSSNKLLLLQFTGSDWCPPCRMLKNQVLDKPEFADYASKNFVLVELDFPRRKALPPEVAQQNQILGQHFGIQVFPSIIILDGNGKKVGELAGYDPRGGLEGFIASLERIRKGG